mgnify:CR=1 FL=1
MREIKFKAKRIDNGEWVEGALTYFQGTAFIHCKENDEDDRCYLTPYEVIPETVCQFTGLIDENGVEVYENDIVKIYDWEEVICNVEYKDYGFCLCGKHFRGGMMPLCVTVGNCYIYVVGNKFDN